MEGSSCGRSPLSVRVLIVSVVGVFTSPVLKVLFKASLLRTAVLQLASALKLKAESSLVATAEKKAGSTLESSVPSYERGAGTKSRVTSSFVAIPRVRVGTGSSGM